MGRTGSLCSGISNDLRLIAEVFRRNYRNVCLDPGPLREAADRLRQFREGGVAKWEYTLVGLRFRIDRPKGSLPIEIGKDLSLDLDVSARGICGPDVYDRLERLAVNIQISARNEASSESNISAWHLDRHISQDDPQEVHPLYHFHHGGKKMAEIKDSIGKVLLLDPPRLPHPPMEALLSIDFILANFVGSVWKELRDDGTYANRIARAQELYWKPYFKSLHSWWDGTPRQSNHQAPALWPNLV